DFRHAEGTRQNAVAACDAARLACRLNDTVTGALDRVCGAHLGARRLLAVHAHHRHCLHALGPIDVLEVDHRVTAVSLAFGACVNARLTSDAAIGIDVEIQRLGLGHRYCCGSSTAE